MLYCWTPSPQNVTFYLNVTKVCNINSGLHLFSDNIADQFDCGDPNAVTGCLTRGSTTTCHCDMQLCNAKMSKSSKVFVSFFPAISTNHLPFSNSTYQFPIHLSSHSFSLSLFVCNKNRTMKATGPCQTRKKKFRAYNVIIIFSHRSLCNIFNRSHRLTRG